MGIMCVINGVGGNGVLWDCVGIKGVYVIFGGEGMGG